MTYVNPGYFCFKSVAHFLSQYFLWVYRLPFNIVSGVILICIALISSEAEDIFLVFIGTLYFFFCESSVHTICLLFHCGVRPSMTDLKHFLCIGDLNLCSHLISFSEFVVCLLILPVAFSWHTEYFNIRLSNLFLFIFIVFSLLLHSHCSERVFR